jgi:hypothetical protein
MCPGFGPGVSFLKTAEDLRTAATSLGVSWRVAHTSRRFEAVKKSTAVILSEAKDLRSCFCFNDLRTTAEMLRCAQHDRIEFFHSFFLSGCMRPSGAILSILRREIADVPRNGTSAQPAVKNLSPAFVAAVPRQRVAPTSRLAGSLRSQDRPWIGRSAAGVPRVRGAQTWKTTYAPAVKEWASQ